MSYCASRLHSKRRRSVVVNIGSVPTGGTHPIRIQSMTTSDTQDVEATVAQAIALAEAGCEIVRVTAPNVTAARCLKDIRARFNAAGFASIPLVADIHFLPQAAMEAVEHVEKIRINPGNYADKKKFTVREYTDADYERELVRLDEAVSPLILRAKALGRSLRIGTNHGSLSDRILNRYGDTPLGMVESALEFVRICERHGFSDIVLSMKASNPKVVIQAYRLLVARMDAAHSPYPLHLGVTEAGDGEDGRIKSAIGIGTLLWDGIGDTIRVSLTEDSVHEIPVARALADRAEALWRGSCQDRGKDAPLVEEKLDPYAYSRRTVSPGFLTGGIPLGPGYPPRVLVVAGRKSEAALTAATTPDTPIEGIVLPVVHAGALSASTAHASDTATVFELEESIAPADIEAAADSLPRGAILARRFSIQNIDTLPAWARLVRGRGWRLAVDATGATIESCTETLRALGDEALLFTVSAPDGMSENGSEHALGIYRRLAAALGVAACRAPLWIRVTPRLVGGDAKDELGRLIDASVTIGGLLADGLGDLISVETSPSMREAVRLAYNVLQGAGARASKTEYVACPSCGRTLFDLQSTTQRIRSQTGHLKGVKIAIMGCIVNGPGEMADADFGYVGGAPGRINLYVGKECVQYNVPQEEADSRLIALIKAHGRWFDAPQNGAAGPS